MMQDMQKQIAILTYQLAEVRSLGYLEKSDHESMVNFENLFQIRKHKENNFLIGMNMTLKQYF